MIEKIYKNILILGLIDFAKANHSFIKGVIISALDIFDSLIRLLFPSATNC